MNIGFIEDTHFHGGTQIWVTEAVQAFLSKGHEVSLLAPEGSWVVEQCRNTGATITSYDWDKVVREDPNNQATWTKGLSRCDVAICTVHPPREGFHCSVFAARCIREASLETYLIPKTGTIVPEYLREFYLPDETINSSIIAIADFTRKYLIDTYNIPAEKVALIYQGTDTERYRHQDSIWSEARKRYQLPSNASPILGSIGSFEHRKGHPVLFEALNELVQGSLPNAHIMMVGDGPDETMLKKKVQDLGLERSVSFFPFTNEPNYVFERIDITVLPSLYKEGLPNVLLESLAMGVPVVSSDIGGVSEIVIDGESGYLVEPGDTSALANAIQKLWGNQDAYKVMRNNARKLIEGQFNKTIQFDRFISYFYELTNKV
jgi:glycosyltransferase involved in cell wall biosynthesis